MSDRKFVQAVLMCAAVFSLGISFITGDLLLFLIFVVAAMAGFFGYCTCLLQYGLIEDEDQEKRT